MKVNLNTRLAVKLAGLFPSASKGVRMLILLFT